MVNQTITNSSDQEVVVEQGTPGSVVYQLTQSQLAQLRAIARLSLVEHDLTIFQLNAYLALPGRSPGHQRRLQDVAGYLLAGYAVAHDRVIRNAWDDVSNNRPEVIVHTVTKYVEPPRKPFFQRVLGG